MKTIRTLLRVIAFGPLMMGISIMAYVFFFNLPFLSAILTGYLFDALSGRAPLGANVWTMLALVAASDGARIASQLGFIRNWARFIATVEAHLKSNMLRGALSARPDRLTLSPGEAVTRFGDDVDKLTRTLDDWCDNIGILVYIVVSSLVLFRIEPRMTLILFSLGLLLVVVSQPLYHRVERLYRDARAAAERVAGFTGEVMGGVQAIKTGTAELRVRARFTALGELRRRAELRSVMLQLVADTFIASTVTSLGTGILLFIAARSIRGGALTVGEFTLFVTTAPRLTEYLRRIGQGLVLVWQSGISLDRMAELNAGGEAELLRRNPVFLRGELPPAAPPELQAPLATLTAAGLSYTYPDGRRGIEAVDLTISRGELVVITGRVGSGKSTLVKALLGLLTPTAGRILWNGQPVTDPCAFFRPPHSAYCPQSPRLFSGSLRDNILLGLAGDPVALADALSDAALDGDVAEMSEGLETVIGPKGARLSGGQVQRVATARMLVRRPELLVVDDLASALDVETERAVWDRMLGRSETTCLAVSHRRTVLARADRIIVLNDGRVEACGTAASLLQTSPEFQRLWETEAVASAGTS
ncbi:MAG: ABC transporter ATP-binding protein [Chloroflexota bacterium]